MRGQLRATAAPRKRCQRHIKSVAEVLLARGADPERERFSDYQAPAFEAAHPFTLLPRAG